MKSDVYFRLAMGCYILAVALSFSGMPFILNSPAASTWLLALAVAVYFGGHLLGKKWEKVSLQELDDFRAQRN